MKKAIIVGYTGQDGRYLTNILEKKKYELIGLSSASVSENNYGIKTLDILNYEQVAELVKKFQPNEIYFLAAVQHSSADIQVEEGELFQSSLNVNVKALINFLESIKKYCVNCKLFYAASSHVFGNPSIFPQNESTPFQPNCIYGIAKTTGIHSCYFYKDNHKVFVSVGIMYNHESPLREPKYVAKKIVETAVAIKKNRKNELVLGNLDAQIDLGYAFDYMNAAYEIMQLEYPDTFIISSGELHTIRDFVKSVFEYIGLDFEKYIKVSPSLITKKQKQNLFGDNSKIRNATLWTPSVNFNGLIKILVDEEILKYEGK